jgi:uncharacterized membrane protein
MRFVYLHLAVFGFWTVANLGWLPGGPAWDPSLVVLATVASVEAIAGHDLRFPCGNAARPR